MTDRTPAQKFYDANGYYERQDTEARLGSTFLAWGADFYNARSHCFDGKDPETGAPKRWLHYNSPELEAARRRGDDDFDQACTVDHSDNPKVVGEIEWMRFIHEWGDLAPEGQKYFTHDGLLWITPTGLPTSNNAGSVTYAEAYFNKPPANFKEDPGFSFKLKIAVFLANGQNWARIEVYDPELADLAQRVYANVQASYHPVAV